MTQTSRFDFQFVRLLLGSPNSFGLVLVSIVLQRFDSYRHVSPFERHVRLNQTTVRVDILELDVFEPQRLFHYSYPW